MKSSIAALRHHQLIRYLVIGGVAYIIEMSVLLLLQKLTNYTPGILVGISFWVGLVASFTLQKYITFKSHDSSKKAISKQATLYAILVLVNYLFTILFVELFTDHFGIILARTLALAITTAWNFIIYKRFIFK